MSSADGIFKPYHKQFKQLVEKDSHGQFKCRYVTIIPPVHSKTYVWFKNGKPYKAFTGSANYSNRGFFIIREALAEDDPEDVYKYYLEPVPHWRRA